MFTPQIQAVTGRDLLPGSRIAVYRNLHKSAWSIRALEGAHKGKVGGHAQAVAITGCHMHVNQRARRKSRMAAPARFMHGSSEGSPNTWNSGTRSASPTDRTKGANFSSSPQAKPYGPLTR